MTAPSFHMVQLTLQTRDLIRLAHRKGLLQRNRATPSAELPYVAHCALGQLFGDLAPRPFALDGDASDVVRVLGYSDADAAALEAAAWDNPHNAPERPMCDWDRMTSRRMPARFNDGARLRFEVRACPVVRLNRPIPAHDQTHKRHYQLTPDAMARGVAPMRKKSGAEVDVFQRDWWDWERAADADTPPPQRHQSYRAWLTARVGDAAELEDVALERFAITRVFRRIKPKAVPKHGDAPTRDRFKRPDATLRGVLRVRDGDAFARLVRRGVGRHKGFGFGMLKLRRL